MTSSAGARHHAITAMATGVRSLADQAHVVGRRIAELLSGPHKDAFR